MKNIYGNRIGDIVLYGLNEILEILDLIFCDQMVNTGIFIGGMGYIYILQKTS